MKNPKYAKKQADVTHKAGENCFYSWNEKDSEITKVEMKNAWMTKYKCNNIRLLSLLKVLKGSMLFIAKIIVKYYRI
jgi:hypothetical protein